MKVLQPDSAGIVQLNVMFTIMVLGFSMIRLPAKAL